MSLQNEFLSGRCERAEVPGLAGSSLDGEGVDADTARPLVIRADSYLRIVVP